MKCLLARVARHGNPGHTIATVSLVELLGFDQIESFLQSFCQLGVRRAVQAGHPRVSAVATVDMALVKLGKTE